MRKYMAGFMAAGSMLALTACGGSSNSTLSYSAFSNAAQKICVQVNKDAQSAGGGASSTANAASAAAVQKVLDASNKGVSELNALKGPSALTAQRDSFVSAVNSNAAIAKKIIAAAKAGDQKTYVSLIKQLAATETDTDTPGSKLGAPACASS